MKSINRWGDIFAIPFFFLLIIYFYNIQDKTYFEWVLFLFSITGFIADSLFTYQFFYTK